MSSFAHIMVVCQSDRWFAWFEDAPHVPSDGGNPMEAIRTLMESFDISDLSKVQHVSVDDGTGDQTEIRIPDFGKWWLKTSPN